MGKMNKITIAASGVVLALVCGASLFTDVAMAQTQQLNTLKNARQYTVYRGKNNITGDRNFLEPTQAPVISDIDVDSNYIYVGTDDRYVYRLDMNNVDLLPERIFEIADSWIRAIEISPDGGTMAVLSQNGELKIRDLNTNDWIDISEGGIDSKIKGAHALVYSPDGKQIAVTCNKGQGNGAALNSSVYIYSIENSASKDISKFVVRLDQILPAPMG
ncbi:MAG: WD40 repeat domain-containing protein, partial [Thermoguttaceae bacterium]|nr:WD40 repeat domain-containing protein [Thermoguttaceae bacterium]